MGILFHSSDISRGHALHMVDKVTTVAHMDQRRHRPPRSGTQGYVLLIPYFFKRREGDLPGPLNHSI